MKYDPIHFRSHRLIEDEPFDASEMMRDAQNTGEPILLLFGLGCSFFSILYLIMVMTNG